MSVSPAAHFLCQDALQQLHAGQGQRAYERARDLIQLIGELVCTSPREVLYCEDALLLRWPGYTVFVFHETTLDDDDKAATGCYYAYQQFSPIPMTRYYMQAMDLIARLPR